MEHDRIVEETRRWIQQIVIGLNLCPFAGRVVETGRIRYAVSDERTPQRLAMVFRDELLLLHRTDIAVTETTLLIHPYVLADFNHFNDFLDVVDGILEATGMAGIIQVASFHPRYRFEGTRPDDVENYTNRSPYPMLHLLRESSVTQAAQTYPDTGGIPERNVGVMRELGRAGVQRLLDACRRRD